MKKLVILAAILTIALALPAIGGDDSTKVSDKKATTVKDNPAGTTVTKTKGEPGEVMEKKMEWNANESGLKWMDVTVGEGKAAAFGDNVECHYHLFLADENGEKGKSVQNSRDPNPQTGKAQTFKFKLGDGNLIKGWNEGMVGMKPGGVRRLLIPPDLGYGARAMGTMIPANSTLFFEIELVSYPGK